MVDQATLPHGKMFTSSKLVWQSYHLQQNLETALKFDTFKRDEHNHNHIVPWKIAYEQVSVSNAQLGNNGISIFLKLSMPSKCVIFNVEYLHQYFR